MYNVELIEDNILKLSGKIDTSNAAEVEEKIFSLCKCNEVVLDLKDLEYISSAGLRILLKLTKQLDKVSAINVSSDIYEIFDMTGFAELIEVKKALRSIDITGCKRIGSGGNGAVYRLNDETIVKVFRPGVLLEDIEAERSFAKASFVAGIPTAIPFDLVKVNESYGNVYELMNSDTLSYALLNYPERRDEFMDKYVALVRKLAETHVDITGFKSYKSIMMERCERLYPVFGNEYTDLLKDILDSMREDDTTLIHGDLHPGNIMLHGDELMLVDMADMTYGSPIFEIVALYRDMGTKKAPEVAKAIENNMGMDIDNVYKTWDDFAIRYFGTDDKSIITEKLGPIRLLYAFFVPIMIATIPEQMQKTIVPDVVEQLIKPVIIPNKDTIKYLLATM